MSEKVPVYIKEVEIVDFKCFRGENKFSFVNEAGEWCQWTVFLGNNNTGKTNLLKAIASLEPWELKDSDPDDNTRYFAPFNFSKECFVPDEDSSFTLNICPTSDEEETIYYKYKFAKASSDGLYEYLKISGYGVVRDIETKGISTESAARLNADNLFNNTKLINFEDWLFQLDYAAKNNQKKAEQRRELLKEVLTSEIFPEINDIRFTSDEKLNNYIEFKTEDGWHRLSELGYGYQATLSWMVDFCKKMFDRYPDSENPLKEPAVLLVDEIDLHLHPQWQRGIVKYLSDIFPATQFIVTTHSPFIIQSMEDVNLFTLNREGDHTVVKHLGNRKFIGWRIEEILSEIMGLEDNIQTDQYQTLINQFTEAVDDEDYKNAKSAYDGLIDILSPQSPERKLLDIQLSQLTPDND